MTPSPRQYTNEFSIQLGEFDRLFMSSQLLDRFTSLETRLSNLDDSLLEDIENVTHLANLDLEKYEETTSKLKETPKSAADYADGISRYEQAVGIQTTICDNIVLYISQMWNNEATTQQPQTDRLSSISEFLTAYDEDETFKETIEDTCAWTEAIKDKENIRQTISALKNEYTTTYYNDLSELELLEEEKVNPLKDKTDTYKGKSHYPQFPELDELIAAITEEKTNFATIKQERDRIQTETSKMEETIAYLEANPINHGELRLLRTQLEKATEGYSETVEVSNKKYKPLEETYRETYSRLSELQETFVKEGILDIETKIRTICESESIEERDITRAGHMVHALNTISTRTEYEHDTSLKRIVDDLEPTRKRTETPIRPVIHTQEPTQGPEYRTTKGTATIKIPDNDRHPSWVAANIERLDIPDRYAAFHASINEGARHSAKATYELIENGRLSHPEPLTHVERTYLARVKEIFSRSQ